jgi:spermidine synthase
VNVAARNDVSGSFSMIAAALTVLQCLGLVAYFLMMMSLRGRLERALDPKGPSEDVAEETADEPTGPAELPLWHAVTVYILAPLIPALLAVLWVGTKNHDSWLRWNRTHMTLGVFRLSYAHEMLDESTWGAPDLVYYNDGLTTTVSVERWGRHYAMKNNGKVDASNGDDMPTQINVAAYPLMFHRAGPRDLDVAIVGFGSGVTVGTTMKFPVRRVDVVELEGSIIEAARFFEDVNHLEYRLTHWPYVEMDRLSIINDDGRNYLASTQQQYDVIISEPSNPWITGVSDLFTVDHWRITKQRLRPGGIYCQWVQLYELSPENIKTIYRTFASQFAHVVVLSADDRSSDTVMLGSDEPIELDLERMRQAYRLPGVSQELERGNVFSPFDIFARILLVNRDEVMQYTHIEQRRRGTERFLGIFERDRWEPDPASTNTGRCEEPQCRRVPAVLNTDDNARIEFAAPNDLIGFSRYEGYLGTIYSERWPYGMPRPPRGRESRDGRLSGFGEGDEASRNYAELALSMIAHGRYGWAGEMIELSQQVGRSRETTVALEVLTHLLTSDNEPSVRIEPPVPGPEMDRRTADQLVDGFDEVREAVDQQAYAAGLAAMERIPAPLRLHSGPGMRLLYAYLLYKAANGSLAHYRTAIEHLEDLVRTDEDYVLRHPEIYYFLARSHDATGDYAAALRAMRAYVEARLVPVDNDSQEVPEPEPGQAPTTDAVGETDKLEQNRG